MTPDPDRASRERAERAKRRAEVFGDVLPDQTRDDTGVPGDEERERDDDLRRDVPPHHGA